jgi:hypothetical protein
MLIPPRGVGRGGWFGTGSAAFRHGRPLRHFAPFVQFEVGHARAYPNDFLDGIDDTDVQYLLIGEGDRSAWSEHHQQVTAPIGAEDAHRFTSSSA